MLRFTFLGFPIMIHWMFWLNTSLMGGAECELAGAVARAARLGGGGVCLHPDP
jgi:hypothetical protein